MAPGVGGGAAGLGSGFGIGVGSVPARGRFGRTPDRRSSSAERSGRPFRQSQHVVDVHSAVKVSAFRAFPQTVARILWTGLDTHGNICSATGKWQDEPAKLDRSRRRYLAREKADL